MRRELLECRRAIDPRARERAGQAVAEHLLRRPEVRSASAVALYAATPDELPTRPMFEALADLGVERLLPRIIGSDLEFAAVERWGDLEAGRFGLLVPATSSRALLELDVVVVPGVAFDAAGGRIGRGGGHYDRCFAEPGPLLVGACFEVQRVEHVPCDSHDRPMDAIVTEEGFRFVDVEEGS